MDIPVTYLTWGHKYLSVTRSHTSILLHRCQNDLPGGRLPGWTCRMQTGFFQPKKSIPKPIPSMYTIFTYIWLIFMVNVAKYTIHGSYGKEHSQMRRMYGLFTYMNIQKSHGTAGIGFQPQKGEGKKRDDTKRCEDGTLTIIKLVMLVCLVNIQ